jgi:hypothetical protein
MIEAAHIQMCNNKTRGKGALLELHKMKKTQKRLALIQLPNAQTTRIGTHKSHFQVLVKFTS